MEYFERIQTIARNAARHLCAKQRVAYTAAFSVEDLTQELILRALKKRDKLEPRLEAGEEGYIFTALRNDGKDALKAERKHRRDGTLEDVEEGLYSERPRMVARKNPDAAPIKIERSVREGFESAFERMHQQRAAWPICLALMDELGDLDAEILRLKIGTWVTPGASTRSIANELGIGESTVRRRWSKIRQQAAELLAQSDAEAC